MPYLKRITPLAVIAAFTLPAFAQETEWTVEPDAAVDHYTAANVDGDDGLSRTEFETYVAARAEDGDEHYTLIKTSGEYDRYFTEKDINADSLLAKDELTPLKDEEDSMLDPKIIDDPDTIRE